jgi:hypothetical protein
VVLGGVVTYVRSGHGVNTYFHLPMSRSMDGWQKYGSFWGTTPMCCSLCSWVAAVSPNPTGGTEWPEETSASCNPHGSKFNSYYVEGWRVWTFCIPFSATRFNRSIGWLRLCGCTQGQVVFNGIARRNRRRTCTQQLKAKLEWLRSARLTGHDQAVRLLDLQRLQVTKDS